MLVVMGGRRQCGDVRVELSADLVSDLERAARWSRLPRKQYTEAVLRQAIACTIVAIDQQRPARPVRYKKFWGFGA